jgi:hypothetical protein
MYQMGVVLFWVYDRSPGSERTRRLVTRTAGLVARLVALSRYRMMRPVTREALDALGEFLTFGDRTAGQPPVTPSANPASRS